MDVMLVRLFLEVAEAGSLSKVAARRRTVQSHVSRQVSAFEAALGSRLFTRTGRGVVLTEYGQRVATRLRLWVQETERIAEELRAEAGKVMGEVRMGIVPSAAHPLVTHLFERLQQHHPGVRLNLAEAQGTELDALLDSGAVDLAIVFRSTRPSGRDEHLLSIAHTYVVSSPGDPVTGETTVSFSRLRDLPLVLPRRPSHWRDALDEAARSLGFQLNAVVEADSLTVQRELVANARGTYSILGPYTIAADLERKRLQASRLVKPDLVRHVVLALPKYGKRSIASRIVAQFVKDIVDEWGQQLTVPMRRVPGLSSDAALDSSKRAKQPRTKAEPSLPKTK